MLTNMPGENAVTYVLVVFVQRLEILFKVSIFPVVPKYYRTKLYFATPDHASRIVIKNIALLFGHAADWKWNDGEGRLA